jgi:hypothetical protein
MAALSEDTEVKVSADGNELSSYKYGILTFV